MRRVLRKRKACPAKQRRVGSGDVVSPVSFGCRDDAAIRQVSGVMMLGGNVDWNFDRERGLAL